MMQKAEPISAIARREGENVLGQLEAEYFRTLNGILEPVLRAGCGSPGVVPIGLIVLETKGWRTGRLHKTAVLAGAIGGCLLVSTVRGRRSHWVKNLRHTAYVSYWSGGQPCRAKAIVFAPDEDTPDLQGLPPLLRSLGANLALPVTDLGCAFALLVPQASSRA